MWITPKSSSFWDEIVSVWSNNEFKKNFRLSRTTFRYLCSQLQPHLQKKTVVRTPLSAEKRLAVALWRLGTNVEYRTISHLFGVGISTVCVAVHEVCGAIVQILLRKYVKMAEGEQLKAVVSGFDNKWKFPQCVGAVDGTHIPIIAPKDNPTDYFNRKGHHSIVMQALVDHRYVFQDIYIGWPGSVHDARPPQYRRIIDGVDVPLLILGDPAYPLLPWLMKPYSDSGRLSQEQLKFNHRLSRARMVVENAFGRLKGRWRCLLKRNDTDVSFMTTLVASCCVLHNICEIHKDEFDDTWLSPSLDVSCGSTPSDFTVNTTTNSQAAATRIRDAIKTYLANQ